MTSLDLRPHSSSILYWILDTQVERMRVESEKWQSDFVFRIMLWSDEKSKIQYFLWRPNVVGLRIEKKSF